MLVYFYLILCSPCFHVNDIKVVDATRVKFEGGREESGSGIQYEILIEVSKSSRKLKIQYVWIDGMNYTPRITLNQNFQTEAEFQKGDTLLLSFTKWINKPEFGEIIEDKLPMPLQPTVKYVGEGLIEAKKRGKTIYNQIDHFRENKPK